MIMTEFVSQKEKLDLGIKLSFLSRLLYRWASSKSSPEDAIRKLFAQLMMLIKKRELEK